MPFASNVMPEMLTVAPITATRSPLPWRMSGWDSAIGPAGFLRGWTVTWSAPTPTRLRFLVMVSALLPRTPLPSTYVPAQTATVSPGRAASIADWMVWKCGAGQPSPTDSVAGGPAASACPLAAATAIAIPTTAADATHFSFRPFISIIRPTRHNPMREAAT